MNETIVEHAVLEPMTAIDARIRGTFNVLGKVANGIVNGNISAVIVSGAAGCGKTYTMEKILGKAESDGLVSYSTVKGAMSAIGLYRELYNAREPGNVLVIDDCDSIFGDLDALNILKAALDTGKTRTVHWNKESRTLIDEGIDRSFDFEGAVVFITNIDFTAEIEADKKMSPHYKAFLSRCMYVDLGIHTKREVLVRITQVVQGQEFLRENGVTKTQAGEMMRWVSNNIARVRVLSIRTVLQLASLIKTDEDWKNMANAILLKPTRHGSD
jgi:ABC-type uncharacterized transport system ATPase subunit